MAADSVFRAFPRRFPAYVQMNMYRASWSILFLALRVSGKRSQTVAQMSWQTACELGFRGSLGEWERLMGALSKRQSGMKLNESNEAQNEPTNNSRQKNCADFASCVITRWPSNSPLMEFRLFYRGPLRANGNPKDKQIIRRAFHPQLKKLWTLEPLEHHTKEPGNYLSEFPREGESSVIHPVSDFKCACLVSERFKTHAELDILFLRPEPVGHIIHTGSGDIDNRLKTLFDGLRMPLAIQEIPPGDSPITEETPFHCLLSDDALISKVAVTTDQLLGANTNDEVLLVIHVRVRGRVQTWANMAMIS